MASLLDLWFRPRTIAVVGASTTPGKLGHTVVRNLAAGGFGGTVYAVNRAAAPSAGAPGLARVSDAPHPVDLAFLAVPAAACPDALADCARAGVAAAVVGASGFAELGTAAGRELQAHLAAIARAAGMRLLGPNTNGLLSVHDGLALGYNASHGERWRPGGVSVLSHSGALSDGFTRRLQGFGGGLARFVAVGNELDITLLELLEALADDPQTDVIGLVLEGLDDGPRLRACAERLATAGKLVVALKIGRSQEGAGATLSHSARLAGSQRAWDAMLRACGFASVRTVEALAGACALRATPRKTTGDSRLLCVTTSGAGGALLADLAAERGLPQASPAAGEAARAIAALPTAAPVGHPVDLGALGDWQWLDAVLAAREAEGLRGPLMAYAHVAPAPGMAQQLLAALAGRRQRCGQPVLVISPGGLGHTLEAAYVEAGIPVFHDASTALDSLAAWYQEAPEPRGPSAAGWPGISAALAGLAPDSLLSEFDSARLLRQAGLPIVDSVIVHDLEQALEQAPRLGYPLALKALVPGVAHKHQAGLVALRLETAGDLSSAFAQQCERVRTLGAEGQAQWLLQPMLHGDLELIAGLSTDAALGQFLVWGLGGIHAEAFDEVELLALPATPLSVQRRLAASRCGRLLNALDASGDSRAAFASLLTTLAELAAAHGPAVDTLDLNPVLATPGRVVAVDALVITSSAATRPG